jgi:hypothetical protein
MFDLLIPPRRQHENRGVDGCGWKPYSRDHRRSRGIETDQSAGGGLNGRRPAYQRATALSEGPA